MGRIRGGAAFDGGLGIAIDASGNIYVTGVFQDTASFGAFSLTSAGGNDVFVAKYDANGNVFWARSAGGTSFETGFSIAVDAMGNSYVTGYFQDTATFDGFSLISSGSDDVFLAKYDSDGNVAWARSNGGIGADQAIKIAVDAVGNSYLTGYFQETAAFGRFNQTSAGGDDVFVAKYDSDGNVLWVDTAGGIGDDSGHRMALDMAGNIYVTGNFQGAASFGSFTLTSAGSRDIFVAKYAVSACGNAVCDPGEDSCNCPDDCGTPPSNEIPGSTCNDGLDNDCDGLTDSTDPDCTGAIPTVSEWGLIVMALLLLAGAKVYFNRRAIVV